MCTLTIWYLGSYSVSLRFNLCLWISGAHSILHLLNILSLRLWISDLSCIASWVIHCVIYILLYYYSGCTLESCDHMSFPEYSITTWPCHMIWLAKSPHYLYPYSVVCFEVLDWVFKCVGNLFLFGALITVMLTLNLTKSFLSPVLDHLQETQNSNILFPENIFSASQFWYKQGKTF